MSQGVFCLLFARKMEHLWKGSSVSDCASGSQESRPSHNKQQDNAEYPASLPKNLFPGWDFPCLASSSTQGTEWIPEPTALQGCTSSPPGAGQALCQRQQVSTGRGKAAYSNSAEVAASDIALSLNMFLHPFSSPPVDG